MSGTPPETGGVEIVLGGNAAVLLRCGAVRVATDPWLGEHVGPWRRLRPPAFRSEALADLTACLISHAHPDHLDIPSLGRMPRETPVLCPAGASARRLKAGGFAGRRVLAEWEAWEGEGLRVVAVPSIHCRGALGYVIELGGRRLYFAGDAGPRTPFAEIRRRCGPLDAALLPVGGSRLAPGPLQRHLTPELAAAAARALEARVTVPIHWGHVRCVPAALDRFRGTAAAFETVMRRVAPEREVLAPPEGVAVRLPGIVTPTMRPPPPWRAVPPAAGA